MREKEIFNTVVAVVGTIGTYIFGSWDKCLIILVIFMALDYITGIICGLVEKKLSSHIGFRGIFKKSTILIVLMAAVLLDRLLNEGTWVFRTLVCYFYIANEGISLLENVARIGVPIPERLIKSLEQLKSKGGKEDNKDSTKSSNEP